MTLNDSGMVVSVQEAVTPSRPEYSESLELKSFIQLELKITVLHITGGSQMYPAINLSAFGVFSGKIILPKLLLRPG